MSIHGGAKFTFGDYTYCSIMCSCVMYNMSNLYTTNPGIQFTLNKSKQEILVCWITGGCALLLLFSLSPLRQAWWLSTAPVPRAVNPPNLHTFPFPLFCSSCELLAGPSRAVCFCQTVALPLPELPASTTSSMKRMRRFILSHKHRNMFILSSPLSGNTPHAVDRGVRPLCVWIIYHLRTANT